MVKLINKSSFLLAPFWTTFSQHITCLALHSINLGSPSNQASLTWNKSAQWVYLILINLN